MMANRLLAASLTVLGACAVNDKPTLVLSVDEHSTLLVTLERGDDHTFGSLRATVNGTDAGAATTRKGSEGITFSEASSPATATWTMDATQLGEAVHVVVTEGDDTFTVDVPTLGSARAPKLLTSLAAPLVPGDRIDVTSGVMTDRVVGGFEVFSTTGDSCSLQWDDLLAPGKDSMGLATPDNLRYDWWCGDYPSAGTLFNGKLSVDVQVAAATTCSGDDLTCPAASLPTMHVDVPVQIQF